MAVAMTFEQVVETVRQCSPKQREILSNLMRRWEIEAVRHEIAGGCQRIFKAVPPRCSATAINNGSNKYIDFIMDGQMNKQLKIIVEKHSDGYVAYPLGLKGVVVSEGDSYEEVLSNIKSAIHFHIKTFSDTDTALIEFTGREIAETRELSENIYVDFDENGNIVSMTVEQAKANVGLLEFSYQEMPLRAAQTAGRPHTV